MFPVDREHQKILNPFNGKTMANITTGDKIEAIMLALSTPKTLKDCLEQVCGKRSDSPSGTFKFSQSDVPSVTEGHIKMMLSLMKPLNNLIESGAKKAAKESPDDKKGNKAVIAEVKKLAKKLKPMKQAPAKLDQNVKELKKTLGIDK